MHSILGALFFLIGLVTLPTAWHFQGRHRLSASTLYAAAAATVAALHLGMSFVLPGAHRGHTVLLISVVTHLTAAALFLYDAWAHPPRLSRARRIN